MPSEYMHFEVISNPFCSFGIVIFLVKILISFFVTFFKAHILKLKRKSSIFLTGNITISRSSVNILNRI